MTAKEIFDQAAADIMEAGGREALFHPEVGDDIPLYVDLVTESEFQPGPLEGQSAEVVTTIEYLISNVGREVNEGEKFTILDDSSVWEVSGPVERSEGFHTVAVFESE